MHLLCITTLSMCLVSFGQAHTWTDRQGSTVEGDLTRAHQEEIVVRLTTPGREVTIPIQNSSGPASPRWQGRWQTTQEFPHRTP